MRQPFVSSNDPLHPIWSGTADYTLRPTLMVIRDVSGFRPADASDFGGSGGGGGSTTTNGQVGITGSNGLSANVIQVGGNNALAVAIISGQTIVSGATINLTGTQTVDPLMGYNVFTPLGFNGDTSASLWVNFNALSSYVVPTGKTLKIDGYALRCDTNFYFFTAIRELMYVNSTTGVGPAPTPLVSGLTVTGLSALTPNSTYIYRTVMVNNVGTTAAGPTGMVTLSGTQNAVTYKVGNTSGNPFWLSDESYFEIYRSPANGGAGSEKFLAATTNLFFNDVIPDSELGLDSPPLVNTSSGIFSGFAYPSGTAPRYVTISTSATVDIVYKNSNLQTRRLRTDSTVQDGSEIIPTSGSAGSIKKIKRRIEGKEWDDIGINQVLYVTPGISATIYGINPLFYIQSTRDNGWTTEIFPKTWAIPEGKEVLVAVGGPSGIPSRRVDLVVYGRLV